MTAGPVAEYPHPEHHREHSFEVKVRTLAGHTHEESVHGDDTVAATAARAVDYFVRHHLLEPGSYTLSLPRLGHDAAGLDPTATLRDVGAKAYDALILVSRKPQTDG